MDESSRSLWPSVCNRPGANAGASRIRYQERVRGLAGTPAPPRLSRCRPHDCGLDHRHPCTVLHRQKEEADLEQHLGGYSSTRGRVAETLKVSVRPIR